MHNKLMYPLSACKPLCYFHCRPLRPKHFESEEVRNLKVLVLSKRLIRCVFMSAGVLKESRSAARHKAKSGKSCIRKVLSVKHRPGPPCSNGSTCRRCKHILLQFHSFDSCFPAQIHPLFGVRIETSSITVLWVKLLGQTLGISCKAFGQKRHLHLTFVAVKREDSRCTSKSSCIGEVLMHPNDRSLFGSIVSTPPIQHGNVSQFKFGLRSEVILPRLSSRKIIQGFHTEFVVSVSFDDICWLANCHFNFLQLNDSLIASCSAGEICYHSGSKLFKPRLFCSITRHIAETAEHAAAPCALHETVFCPKFFNTKLCEVVRSWI